ncbi:MAG: hypothetical protein GTN81_14015 [Proteobacteria bacterium]|nr:hypothetical protein [Pseudomonadota bacterium]
MIQTIILIVVLVGAGFFTVRYFRKIFSGKGPCCSDSGANCPIKDREASRP